MNDDDILGAAREGFLAEATDMLSQFEQALLDMESDPGNAEAINSAFRAAHTIKGAAGMFGYADVVEFTHELEGVLDDMRAGGVAATESVFALLLLGRDQMGELVECVGQPLTGEQRKASSELGAKLKALRMPGAAASVEAQAVAADAPASNTAAAASWHVSLRMGADALRNGLDPASFIRYLGSLGTVTAIRTLVDTVPALADLDPENCHLGFEIRVAFDGTQQALEEVFEFLREDSDLAVLPADAGHDAFEALLARRAPTAAGRDNLLSVWQQLAGPNAPPFVERRQAPVADRRENEPERRSGSRDRRGGDESRFIRVRADKLDRLIDLIGELVTASSGAQLVARETRSAAFGEASQRIHDLVQEARDGALGLRMVPIGETFNRFQRVVRDVGKQLDKDVALTITGGDTELDKSMVDVIADPLMHLVRNAMDHGIETAAQRMAAGKPAQGQLSLNAYHESGAIVIEVSDDGRGLDRERILSKAIERGLTQEGAEVDDDTVYQFIFAPGFSTAGAVTNLSGRGVGMDVVKRNIESLRGQVSILNRPGLGATLRIRLPLTLAIIDGFLTSVGGVSYVIPLELVAECIAAPASWEPEAGEISGHFDLRGEVLPVLDIGRFYRHRQSAAGKRNVVVVRDGTHRVGLVVDRLLGEHQTVIKPLSNVLQTVRGLSGCTILGSGEVALILDVPALLDLAINRLARTPRVSPPPTRHPEKVTS